MATEKPGCWLVSFPIPYKRRFGNFTFLSNSGCISDCSCLFFKKYLNDIAGFRSIWNLRELVVFVPWNSSHQIMLEFLRVILPRQKMAGLLLTTWNIYPIFVSSFNVAHCFHLWDGRPHGIKLVCSHAPAICIYIYIYTLQGIHTSHLGERKIIFKHALGGEIC